MNSSHVHIYILNFMMYTCSHMYRYYISIIWFSNIFEAWTCEFSILQGICYEYSFSKSHLHNHILIFSWIDFNFFLQHSPWNSVPQISSFPPACRSRPPGFLSRCGTRWSVTQSERSATRVSPPIPSGDAARNPSARTWPVCVSSGTWPPPLCLTSLPHFLWPSNPVNIKTENQVSIPEYYRKNKRDYYTYPTHNYILQSTSPIKTMK